MHWSDDETFWEAMEPALSAPSRLALAERDAAAILGALDLPLQAPTGARGEREARKEEKQSG